MENSDKKQLKMISGAFYISKDNKQKPQGDDANFISSDEQTIGVADGVSGWNINGIDAGEYARQLMLHSAIIANKGGVTVPNPKRVMRKAFSCCTNIRGASTACLITLKDGVLRAANVGDSQFMVFRGSELLYTSPIQKHRHKKAPYQLGNESDHPNCALEIKVEVKEGDVVVLGTDGLFDNMSSVDIMTILESNRWNKSVEELAWALAEEAYHKSLHGGKRDDITVIVGQIEPLLSVEVGQSLELSSFLVGRLCTLVFAFGVIILLVS